MKWGPGFYTYLARDRLPFPSVTARPRFNIRLCSGLKRKGSSQNASSRPLPTTDFLLLSLCRSWRCSESPGIVVWSSRSVGRWRQAPTTSLRGMRFTTRPTSTLEGRTASQIRITLPTLSKSWKRKASHKTISNESSFSFCSYIFCLFSFARVWFEIKLSNLNQTRI